MAWKEIVKEKLEGTHHKARTQINEKQLKNKRFMYYNSPITKASTD